MFCAFSVREYIGKKFNVLNYLFFAPVFFASIGMQTNMKSLTGDIIWFTVVLTIVAILTKVVGCGLGAKICKFNNKEALGIGIGMIFRNIVPSYCSSSYYYYFNNSNTFKGVAYRKE